MLCRCARVVCFYSFLLLCLGETDLLQITQVPTFFLKVTSSLTGVGPTVVSFEPCCSGSMRSLVSSLSYHVIV